MKIAILTSGILPVPATQGGAVENLIDFYLEYNDRHKLHDITVYSIWDPNVIHHPALISKTNHYYYIKTGNIIAKIKKNIYYLLKGDEYYHYSIEYFLEQAIKHIKKQGYDMVLIENRPGFVLKLRERINTNIIFHLHNSKLDNKTKKAQSIYNSANRIITVSDFITNRVKTINQDDKKCVTVHNGIDLSSFSHQFTSSYERKKLGFTSEDFIIVFSGRLNKEKGIQQLIEALINLKQHSQIKLLVIGSSFYGNTNKDDAFISSLKEKAQYLNNRIVFTGFIQYNIIPQYLKMSNIAVIPSVWDDPFPTTVLEAQAMGLPIISTKRGGIPEEVTPDNAILLETDEHFIDNLSNAILDLYLHPEKRDAMCKASLERSKLFDKERYAREFFKALENI